jgi:hypothetical protein
MLQRQLSTDAALIFSLKLRPFSLEGHGWQPILCRKKLLGHMVSTSATLLLMRPSDKRILIYQTPNGGAEGTMQVLRLLSLPERVMTSMTEELEVKE